MSTGVTRKTSISSLWSLWANGQAVLLRRGGGRATLGADKAYQEERFITALWEQNITPHVAENAASKHWPNWLRPQEREHPGFVRSQQK